MSKKWTDEEIRLLKENYDKCSNKELSQLIGRSEKAVDYQKGKLGLRQNISEKDRGNQRFFQTIDTEEKAYRLGFIYADGYITHSNRNYELGIELSAIDIDHLHKFNKVFNNYYKVEYKIGNYNSLDRFNGVEIRNKECKNCIIRVYSKAVFLDLLDKNIVQDKSYSELFPRIDDNVLFLHFLRGYIDGDGSYCFRNNKYHYPRISITGNNIKIFEFIKEKMENDFNLHPYICSDRNCYKINFARQDECKQLVHLLYDNATIYLDRKYLKANEIEEIAVHSGNIMYN